MINLSIVICFYNDNRYLAYRNMTKDIVEKLFSGSSNHDIFEYIYNLNKLETVDTSDVNYHGLKSVACR